MDATANVIQNLNDAFRTTLNGGKVLLSASVAGLNDRLRSTALSRVRSFDEFSDDNDPHGEHDFGAFDLAEYKFFWKIDYYDDRCEFGSEDPADPNVTTRVLTVMLAEDY